MEPSNREKDSSIRFIFKPLGLIFLVIVPIVALIALSVRYRQVTTVRASETTVLTKPVPPAPVVQSKEGLHPASVLADLQARKVDRYTPTVPEADTSRNFTGENTRTAQSGDHAYRDASNGGWFSLEIAVAPDIQNDLVLTYYGGDSGTRAFDILVDGEKIGAQRLDNQRPGSFMDVTYIIPLKLTQGKPMVRLRLQATDQIVGGIWDIWVVKREGNKPAIP